MEKLLTILENRGLIKTQSQLTQPKAPPRGITGRLRFLLEIFKKVYFCARKNITLPYEKIYNFDWFIAD